MNLSPRTFLGLALVFILAGSITFWFIPGPFDVPDTAPEHDREAARRVLNTLHLQDYTPNRGSKAVRKILLVTVDTLRADHLPAYGYPRATAPFLSGFAEDAVQFDRAFAPMSTTSPSHASLLTALYPRQHRVTSNMKRMEDAVLTLPEMLRKQGYRTAGFVATNRHFRAANLDQGFDVFDEPKPAEEMTALNHRRQRQQFHYRSGRATVQRALEWFETQPPSSSYFVWIHLFDPHADWAYRNRYYREVRGNKARHVRWVNHVENVHHVDLTPGDGWFDGDAGERLHAYRLYDAEIRYVDRTLQSLFQRLDELGTSPELSVVTADHGEGMGNHGWWAHSKHIYNEQIRVPLWLRWSDRRYASTTVDTAVELNDLAPTLLRAAGAPRSLLRRRRLPIEGEPLQKLLGDSPKGSFGHAFVQRRTYQPITTVDWILDRLKRRVVDPVNYPFRETYGLSFQTEIGEKYSLVSGERKLIHATEFRDQLYDLDGDFYEQRNRAGDKPAVAGRLREHLHGILRELDGRRADTAGPMDERAIQRLEGLGYTQ